MIDTRARKSSEVIAGGTAVLAVGSIVDGFNNLRTIPKMAATLRRVSNIGRSPHRPSMNLAMNRYVRAIASPSEEVEVKVRFISKVGKTCKRFERQPELILVDPSGPRRWS
ncbi:BZ3500_MvSof-1268-A1-R1_Chr2-2g05148 [Microbotryum saponariae]|uniref:BZ3500_MvSof-1268-A1-R1_Chr2-2g05148 protein n=1 Tax=Microbotryum saponariae TaxID=289078 RepID=A0A2X0K4Q8_9BASI|nr:BZ3500_MvSof-1268-A1-R1_Chr2-2g05148 [Microbotryum saponariae]SDA00975.1 BZ3501_MvSof-1269-A2-R1_Chr2-2g04822 [Microbotryum saponariae]